MYTLYSVSIERDGRYRYDVCNARNDTLNGNFDVDS